MIRWLLDLVVTVAFISWQWSRERPGLRLAPRAMTPVKRIVRASTGFVAVLVSRPAMEQRVLRALGDYTTLRFTRTWAELQQVVMRRSPCAIVADPLADKGGDPKQHLTLFSRDWRIPVVLYAVLAPASEEILLVLGHVDIQHVIFHRFDDGLDRFVEVIPWERDEPPLHAA